MENKTARLAQRDALIDGKDNAKQRTAWDEYSLTVRKMTHRTFYSLSAGKPAYRACTDDALYAQAEEYAQEILIRLVINNYKRLRTFRGESKLSTWTMAVIINYLIDQIFKPNRSYELIPLEIESEDSAESNHQWLEDKTQNVERAILDSERIDRVKHCVDQLPADQRTAYVECVIMGRPTKHVAEELERSVNAINKLKQRARASLRACFDEWGID